jgi:hypothetical protein
MNRPLLALLTLCSLFACNVESTLGTGMDSGGHAGDPAETAEPGGYGGEDPAAMGTGASEAGRGTRAGSGGQTSGSGASAGRGGAAPAAGRGGTTSSEATGGMGGRGGGSVSSAGSESASSGMGSTAGMEAMAGAPSGGTSNCQSNWLDTNQGSQPPPAEDCPALGETLKQAHDAALEGKELEVAPLVGTWADGSGSARIELVLDATGLGTLRFGEATDFPEITDPDEPYLTTVGERDADQIFDLAHLTVRLGFGYRVIADEGRGSEMSFHILTMEPWEEWCALQRPVQSPYARACYACTYDAGRYSFFEDTPAEQCGEEVGCYEGVLDSDPAKRVNCGRYELCLDPYHNVCNCTVDGCFANVAVNDQLTVYPFSATLDAVDTTVLRLASLSELREKTTYYLEKQE